MTNQPIPRVCGVPEHFNRAWRTMGAGAVIEWQEVPEGTGRMLDLLSSGVTDIAILLTEGAIAGAARGIDLSVIGVWVETPLNWGVHVPAASSFHQPNDVVDRRVAVSRMGSGSHLMAGIYARQHGWKMPVDYVTVDTLEGARVAFAEDRADVFLWERATTAPLVAAGEFRRIDILPTPWPCFVACCHRDIAHEQRRALSALVGTALDEANNMATDTDAVSAFSNEYGLDQAEISQWLAQTRWANTVGVDPEMLSGVQATLLDIGLTERALDIDKLIT
ncbi:MAG: ABC transporter substrate-binding protein [Pseudomonadota bacterium]